MKKVILISVLTLLSGGFVLINNRYIIPNYRQPATIPFLTDTSIYAIPRDHYNDGQYTGAVVDAHYGNIQVEVTITKNKIISIKFLQYPHERQNSRRLNLDAMPKLQSEAIVVQSTHVDGITGASLTSAAFVESLSSALEQAK